MESVHWFHIVFLSDMVFPLLCRFDLEWIYYSVTVLNLFSLNTDQHFVKSAYAGLAISRQRFGDRSDLTELQRNPWQSTGREKYQEDENVPTLGEQLAVQTWHALQRERWHQSHRLGLPVCESKYLSTIIARGNRLIVHMHVSDRSEVLNTSI